MKRSILYSLIATVVLCSCTKSSDDKEETAGKNAGVKFEVQCVAVDFDGQLTYSDITHVKP